MRICKKIGTSILLAALLAMIMAVSVSAADTSNNRYSSRVINGTKFELTIDLSKWDKNTTVEQIDIIEDLFFQVYPQMYDRFGGYNNAATHVIIAIENEGYSPATGGGNRIHLHDKWLKQNPNDFDVLVHELGHILDAGINGGFDHAYLEYNQYVENFADYCRFVYAYNDGQYNDGRWVLQDTYYDREHNGREHSVRFLVWLDYLTFSGQKDVIRDYFELCCDKNHPKEDWDDVWEQLFIGTRFQGESVDDVWKEYLDSDFSHYDSKSKDGRPSELIRMTNVRQILKENGYSQTYEDGLKYQ